MTSECQVKYWSGNIGIIHNLTFLKFKIFFYVAYLFEALIGKIFSKSVGVILLRITLQYIFDLYHSSITWPLSLRGRSLSLPGNKIGLTLTCGRFGRCARRSKITLFASLIDHDFASRSWGHCARQAAALGPYKPCRIGNLSPRRSRYISLRIERFSFFYAWVYVFFLFSLRLLIFFPFFIWLAAQKLVLILTGGRICFTFSMSWIVKLSRAFEFFTHGFTC